MGDRILPPGWSLAPLCDVVEINPRPSPAIPNEVLASFVPMSAVEAGTGRLNLPEDRYWAKVRRGYTTFSEGDVLFAKITPCMENGKAAIAKGLTSGIGAGSTEFFVLRPTPVLNARFLLHFILQEQFRSDARAQMRGNAGQLRVPKSFFETVDLPLPPLAEQHRIVAEIETQFARLDAAEAALERAKANLKRYRTSVLGNLTVAPNDEAASNDGAHWTEMTVDDAATEVRYGTSAKTNDDASGIPIIRMGNIQEGRLVMDSLKYLSPDHPEFPALLLEPGDLLFNRTNSAELVGKSAVYRDAPVTHSFASYLIRVRFKEQFWPEFFAHYINSPYGRNWIKSVVNQQVGQANVNGAKLRNLRISVPPFSVQNRLASEIDHALENAEQLESDLLQLAQRTATLRQSILQRAFAGQLVAQDPADEPAAALLARIAAERAVTAPAARKRAARRTPGATLPPTPGTEVQRGLL